MAKRFTKVAPALWRSKRFLSLPSDQERLLHLYFLTSRHQTSIGAYEIPDGYAIDDLGWTPNQYQAARRVLVEAGLIAFDEASSIVHIFRWFKHCPPMNPAHASSCAKLIDELDSEPIRALVLAEFNDHAVKKGVPLQTGLTDSGYPRPAGNWAVVPGAARRAGRG